MLGLRPTRRLTSTPRSTFVRPMWIPVPIDSNQSSHTHLLHLRLELVDVHDTLLPLWLAPPLDAVSRSGGLGIDRTRRPTGRSRTTTTLWVGFRPPPKGQGTLRVLAPGACECVLRGLDCGLGVECGSGERHRLKRTGRPRRGVCVFARGSTAEWAAVEGAWTDPPSII